MFLEGEQSVIIVQHCQEVNINLWTIFRVSIIMDLRILIYSEYKILGAMFYLFWLFCVLICYYVYHYVHSMCCILCVCINVIT